MGPEQILFDILMVSSDKFVMISKMSALGLYPDQNLRSVHLV